MFCTNPENLRKYTAENRLWQGIPSIEVTKKGRIFITFYSGETEETIGNYAVLIMSDDGKTFSEPIAAAFEKEHRCFDPCLWIDPLNRLWFTWAYAPENAVYGTVCENPDAPSLKWSGIRKIGNDVMMNKPIVRKNGEWLLPIAVWAKSVVTGGVCSSKDPDKKAFVYLSYDDGKTFHKLDGADAAERSFDEHMVIELNDSKLAMYIRTRYGIAVSYSYDGGRTWTEAKDSGLGGPCSRFHIRRLKSGRILLINHYNFKGRNNLTAMLSEDNGKTWKHKLLIDERNDVSYPDAAEADDGYIYITYDRERGAYKKTLDDAYSCAREILLAKITEQDIIAGKLTDKNSRLKTVVSRLGKYIRENDDNPYHELKRYSDTEICNILADKNEEDIVSELFSSYEINCMNMYKIDRKRMDFLIDKLKNECSDKKGVIFELVKLIRGVTVKETEDIPIVSAVKKIIEKDISRNITLDEISESMNMSKYYLCHIFKKTTNMTLTDWKNYLKTEKAKELLLNSDLKIIDIALECGFGTASYFSEVFAKREKIAPEAYRTLMRNTRTEEKSAVLKSMLPKTEFLDTDIEQLRTCDKIKTYFVTKPSEELKFLHEAAIVEFHKKLIAAWYNNKKLELNGYTPIRFAVSENEGESWSLPVTVAGDISGKLLYCPPVFGIENDSLYMFLNTMSAADHIHSLDLYIYNENENRFEFVWSRAVPFKLNTNVYKMDNGKLIMPGRFGELDGFPQIPGVLISDSGKINAEWRAVKITESKTLPDGSEFIHPEVSLITDKNKIYAFCRNDERNVPIIFLSDDYGEHWTGAHASDIPFANSKIYSGTLSDGRNYVIGSLTSDRKILYILFSRSGEMKFNKGFILQNGFSEELGCGYQWSYPSAYESNGKLYVIYTVAYNKEQERGAVVSVIDTNII